MNHLPHVICGEIFHTDTIIFNPVFKGRVTCQITEINENIFFTELYITNIQFYDKIIKHLKSMFFGGKNGVFKRYNCKHDCRDRSC